MGIPHNALTPQTSSQTRLRSEIEAVFENGEGLDQS